AARQRPRRGGLRRSRARAGCAGQRAIRARRRAGWRRLDVRRRRRHPPAASLRAGRGRDGIGRARATRVRAHRRHEGAGGGRRRSAVRAQALGIVDEVAAADALSHALGVARRIATGEFSGALFSPLTEAGTLAFPNVERDTEIARLLAHHAAVPRSAPAAAIVEAVRTGLTQGLHAGLALEARRFGELTASNDGHAGID